MLVMAPDGGALIPRMICGGRTMDTEERRAWKLLFEKVNMMDDTQRRAAVVRCKKTGEDIATKLDGGQCACMTAEACCLQDAVLDRIARSAGAMVDAVAAERERCAKVAVQVAEAVERERWESRTGRMVTADRERCVKLLEALPQEHTWWDIAGVIEKMKKGEGP